MTDGMRPGQDTGGRDRKEMSQFSRPKSSRPGYGERMSLLPGSRRSEHSQASDAIFFPKSTFSPHHGYILTWNGVGGHGDQTPPPCPASPCSKQPRKLARVEPTAPACALLVPSPLLSPMSALLFRIQTKGFLLLITAMPLLNRRWKGGHRAKPWPQPHTSQP